MSGPGQAELAARISATDVEALRAAARTFEGVATEAEHTVRCVDGVRVGCADYWRGRSATAFSRYGRTAGSTLSDGAVALREMAGHLRAHAAATEEAQAGLRHHPDTDRATEVFHESEQRVRQALWRLGAAAPGGVPLPILTPAPVRHGWMESIDPTIAPVQLWLNGRGRAVAQQPGDFGTGLPVMSASAGYRPGLFGYDEDGRLVPAYAADPLASTIREDAGGLAISEMLEVVFANRVDAVDYLMNRLLKSVGFRAGHINRHIRQFYNLPKHEHGTPNVVPNWAHDNFVALLRLSLEDHGRVFHWHLKSDKKDEPHRTFAYMYNDTRTHKWLGVEFYDEDGKLGEFATAVPLDDKQCNDMLAAEWVKKGGAR